jgi:hypothetical protein
MSRKSASQRPAATIDGNKTAAGAGPCGGLEQAGAGRKGARRPALSNEVHPVSDLMERLARRVVDDEQRPVAVIFDRVHPVVALDPRKFIADGTL